MNTFLASNNAQTTLAGSITSTATTAALAPGSGALLPVPSAGTQFALTFIDAATGLVNEIVYVTGMSGDNITSMLRAQEGTTGKAWLANDIAANLYTAGQDSAKGQITPIQTGAYNYGADTGTANTYSLTTAPVFTPGAGSIVGFTAANANTGASTFRLNSGTTYPIWGAAHAPLQGGEISTGYVELEYNPTLNSGSPAWVLLESTGGAMQISPAITSKQAATAGQVTSGSLGTATAAGTANAITASFAASPVAYVAGQPFTIIAASTNTGAMTAILTLGGTAQASVSIVKGNNQPVVAGDFPAGYPGEFAYSASFGALVLNNPATGISAAISQATVLGTFKNFKADAIGINNYNCVVTCDEIVLENSAGSYMTAKAVNKTINANGTVGAPLSIMSSRAAGTWYYRWLWYNATNGLTATLDASSTAPTAPTGYVSTDYKAPLPGACRTDSSGSTYLLQISTRDRLSFYVILTGSNTANLPLMASGAAGSVSTPTWVAVAVGAFVPTATASVIRTSVFGGATNGTWMAAPNNSYGAMGSTSNPPPFAFGYPSGNLANDSFPFSTALESSNIYWASSSAGLLSCIGWEDN